MEIKKKKKFMMKKIFGEKITYFARNDADFTLFSVKWKVNRPILNEKNKKWKNDIFL